MDHDPLAETFARMARGDRAALRVLYAEAAPKLFGICIRMLRDRTEAEDALQEIMTRLWTRASRFDPARGSAMTWAVVIARNHCLDRLRARRDPVARDEAAMAAVPDAGPSPETLALRRGEARRIVDCLGQLDPQRAQAIRSAYLDGESYEGISRALGVPLNTLRSWLHRGLKALRECMEP
ncbi:sigma-70 family RNA polymerase sigma factor [Frigidibacter sp. MR17.14]|uniref:sigma-70 family RNA polymerase sigma factor n=1 Tax=Frigidibacter sp. MR17.14 TaxID=3126509 RepID=UPI003012ABA2